MENEEFEMLVGVLKVLADESRMKILGLLAQHEYNVKELSEMLGLKEPTVSHHLAKLYDHELVSMRRDGTAHFYWLNRKVLQRFRKDFFSAGQVENVVEVVNEDVFERGVFRTCLQGGKIVHIPSTWKKKLVILRWLGKFFEEGIEYSHKDVNAIIKPHHSDTATLRRELIGIEILARDRDIYWKLPSNRDKRVLEKRPSPM
jgi:hypothetical protein